MGLSPKPDRDSYRVARYLQQQRITVIPIRPGQKEILGEKAYPSLDDVSVPVDIVDVFRSSDKVLAHAHEALRLEPRAFWMQLNIENLEAAELLTTAGIDVVMNRCIKIEYERLFNRSVKYKRKRHPEKYYCACCTGVFPFSWTCRCGFQICQKCMLENFWGMSCNGITWQCPDCGQWNGFGNQ